MAVVCLDDGIKTGETSLCRNFNLKHPQAVIGEWGPRSEVDGRCEIDGSGSKDEAEEMRWEDEGDDEVG